MLTHPRATPRRLLIAATGLALAAASLTAVASPATAATSTSTSTSTTNVTVTGTSDVYDSSLIQSVIAPGFASKYPQYKLNYISEGTGKAIADAENGVSDALIVHAPSLENQFVAGVPINSSVTTTPPAGTSYSTEPAGRAIFWGDYILAGATSDPAGVDATVPATAAPHDIVKAFEDVATTGAAGNAFFVSRGGTPGTTVQEHAIWALTSGVPTCNVSAANGGGTMPSTTDIGTDCPATPTPPSWYKITGLTQGPNIVNANTCNYGANSANSNNCYVFTDRGTFNYLQSGTNAQAGNLSLLVRDNNVANQTTLLVNTFHAYAVNPAAVPGGNKLNTAGAKAFLDYLTSPVGQAAIGQYLNGTNDPPFIPDAAPQVSVAGRPTSVTGSSPVTITGSLSNVVPGTPAPSGVRVQLLTQPAATPNAAYTQVTSTTTGDDGRFSLKVTPFENANYEVTTSAVSKQFEYDETTPPNFYDALQATTTTLGTIDVQAVVSELTATGSKGKLTVRGDIRPHRVSGSHLSLYARPAGTTTAFKYYGRKYLGTGNAFTAVYSLPAGKYNYYVSYGNSGYVQPAKSATGTATVS